MKILYISITFPKETEGNNLYTNLAEEIAKKHNITVLVAEEKKKIKHTKIGKERNLEVIRVKVGNMYNVSFIEKAISYIMMPYYMNRAIKKILKDRKYDMVLYTSPPITIEKVVKYAKKKFRCIAYLMQKDIFPQNAVDIGIMKKNSLPYLFFKRKEKKLYKMSDKIGCMSNGNIKYLKENNTQLKGIEKKLEKFPNTLKIRTYDKINVNEIKGKYNIPDDKIVALYGGNFGRPQGIDFIIELLKYYKDDDNIYWLFVGSGTEKGKLLDAIQNDKIKNASILDYIPTKEYSKILQIADIGLIFLDKNFTIPNIPSRLLSYLEYEIPVLAATDKNTDLHQILEDNNIGLWCDSNRVENFVNKINYYIENPEIRIQIGKNGRRYLEENLTTEKSVQILENAYKELRKERK